jgi:hypothetical protein
MAGQDSFRYVRYAFAVFSLISLLVVGVEGWRNGISITTLAIRAAIIVVGIRFVCSITIGVLRGYEEIQGS